MKLSANRKRIKNTAWTEFWEKRYDTPFNHNVVLGTDDRKKNYICREKRPLL